MISLHFVDIAVIVLYLLAIIAIGIYVSHKNKTTEAYFLGNRSFSGWVIGLSMLGTSISSVTFLAFPAAAYNKDWSLVIPNLFLPFVIVIAVWVFIPFFRRANLVSAFEYLEDRYGPLVRLYGAVSFILLQVIRLGTILFLVSLLIQSFVDADITTIIICAGVFVAFYTIIGGIEAVIWTDVIQSIVLIFAGLVTFLYIWWQVPNGLSGILSIASENQKFLPENFFIWNIKEKTFWTMAILGCFLWLTEYSSNQNVIQRYAAAKSTYEAKKASILCAAISVPTWVFFCFLGTCLFAFYQTFPEAQVIAMEADKVYPYFIVSQLPLGVTGIVIAGVLAAAMSSLDSSINAISAVSVVDILKRYIAKNKEDMFYLKNAKLIAAISSALMIIMAIILSDIEQKESMQNLQLIMASIFGGCLFALYMLGFFVPRVHYKATLISLACATIFNVYLLLNEWGKIPKSFTIEVHSFWVGILVNLVFIVIACTLSIFLYDKKKNLEKLTVWT